MKKSDYLAVMIVLFSLSLSATYLNAQVSGAAVNRGAQYYLRDGRAAGGNRDISLPEDTGPLQAGAGAGEGCRRRGRGR